MPPPFNQPFKTSLFLPHSATRPERNVRFWMFVDGVLHTSYRYSISRIVKRCVLFIRDRRRLRFFRGRGGERERERERERESRRNDLT
jgi:hypothetical protein